MYPRGGSTSSTGRAWRPEKQGLSTDPVRAVSLHGHPTPAARDPQPGRSTPCAGHEAEEIGQFAFTVRLLGDSELGHRWINQSPDGAAHEANQRWTRSRPGRVGLQHGCCPYRQQMKRGTHHTPRSRAKIARTLRGRPHTPERRAKISAALRGRRREHTYLPKGWARELGLTARCDVDRARERLRAELVDPVIRTNGVGAAAGEEVRAQPLRQP